MMFNFPARGHEAKKYDYINVEINVKNCNKGKLKRRTSFEPYIRIKLLGQFAVDYFKCTRNIHERWNYILCYLILIILHDQFAISDIMIGESYFSKPVLYSTFAEIIESTTLPKIMSHCM